MAFVSLFAPCGNVFHISPLASVGQYFRNPQSDTGAHIRNTHDLHISTLNGAIYASLLQDALKRVVLLNMTLVLGEPVKKVFFFFCIVDRLKYKY